MSQDQLDEIRQKINLVDLVSEYTPLKKAGRNFKALCPFHSEKTPSFIVSPERQIFKCFGCGEGGDIFSFLMKAEGMEFSEALEKLADRAGIKLKDYHPSQDWQKKQHLFEINHLAAEFYHFLLLSHQIGKKALDYILGRGISRDSLMRFKLGYSPPFWDGLQKFMVSKKKYRLDKLEEAGLIIRSQRGFYDRFRDRLMFPLRDYQGNICGFAGRVLEKEAKAAKYVNSPETPVYFKSQLLYGLWLTRSEIKKRDEVVLVEGELDAISSYQAGVKSVAAVKGSALTEGQLNLIRRFTKNLILALDADFAGDAAAKRGIELADRLGFAVKVVEVKGGKDPDEVARKNPGRWRKLVSQAMPVYDFFLNSAFNRYNVKTAEGKRKIGQELAPILAKINDNIVQAHYLSQVASRLGVSEEAVSREVAKLSRMASLANQPISVPGFVTVSKTRQEVLEEYLLSLCFQSNRWSDLTKKSVKKLITVPAYKRIIKMLKQYFGKHQSPQGELLVKMLPAELIEIYNQFYLNDLGDWLTDGAEVKKEIKKTIQGLKKTRIKTRLKELAREIALLEKDKDQEAKLEELNQKFRRLSAKLV
ncbi:MAG: DNA primase [Candidatus Pacebacteria bacterium]|nr:DNA primase [Candidatus Paceibacterota bacterium]